MLILLGKLEPKHNPRKLVQSSVRLRCIFPFALAKKKKAKSQAWVCAWCRKSLLDALTLSAHRRVSSVDYRCTSLRALSSLALALRPCVLRSQPFLQHKQHFLWEPRARKRVSEWGTLITVFHSSATPCVDFFLTFTIKHLCCMTELHSGLSRALSVRLFRWRITRKQTWAHTLKWCFRPLSLQGTLLSKTIIAGLGYLDIWFPLL